MKDGLLYLMLGVAMVSMATAARAQLIRMYADPNGTFCGVSNVQAGQTFDVYVFFEGASSMGVAFRIESRQSSPTLQEGDFTVVDEVYNDQLVVYGTLLGGPNNGSPYGGIFIMYACHEPPVYLGRITCRAIGNQDGLVACVQVSAGAPSTDPHNPTAFYLDCGLIDGAAGSAGYPKFIVNPTIGCSPLCEVTVPVEESTWGAIKSQFQEDR